MKLPESQILLQWKAGQTVELNSQSLFPQSFLSPPRCRISLAVWGGGGRRHGEFA